MRIAGYDVWQVETKLKKPYQIAYDRFDSVSVIYFRLKTSSKIIGLGCAAPEYQVTGESANDCLDFLQNLGDSFPLIRHHLFSDVALHRNLSEARKRFPSAIAALDMALWDLKGKHAGLPVCNLLGRQRTHMPCYLTIGIDDVASSMKQVKEAFERGFFALKIKGGLDLQRDLDLLSLLMSERHDSLQIGFDANQGYDLEDASRFMEVAQKWPLQFIEQPVRQDDISAMRQLSAKGSGLIMGDEMVLDDVDVWNAGMHRNCELVNIKLMKCGGLSSALTTNNIAQRWGLKALVGCMDEPALSIAAGLHLALAETNIAFADLDGHLDLADDPTSDAVAIRNGHLYPSLGPGFGLKDL